MAAPRPRRPSPKPTRLRLLSHGVRVDVEVESSALLPAVRRHLPPGTRRARGGEPVCTYALHRASGGRWTLTRDGERLVPAVRARQALDALEGAVQLQVATHAPGLVFVHAGVVALGGRALLLPGYSFSGKSTLVTALLRAGATYYSDEYAVLDAQGRVHPYPRRLALRAGPGRPPRRLEAARLGARTGRRPLPVGLVLSTTYQSGAVWSPQPLTPGQAVLALFAHTVSARQRPREALATLTRALAHARAFSTARAEAAGCVPHLLALARGLVNM